MNRKIVESIASLYGAQIFGYLIPLLTLPYLARCLGTNQWGSIAFAEAYAANLSILIEYGFGLSASREVAKGRHDTELLSRQASEVLGAQVFLTVLAVIASGGVALLLPRLVPHGITFIFAILIAAGRSLTPIWFFQGIENLRLVSLLSVGANILAAAAVFGFVHSPSDAWKVLALRSISSWAVALIAVYLVFRQIRFSPPSIMNCWKALQSGAAIFMFKSAVSFYTTANVLLLGALADSTIVAWFAGAEKLSKVAISASGPISQAFYSRISNLAGVDRRAASREFLWSARLMIGVGLTVGTIIFVAAPLLVRVLLGNGFQRSVPVLRVMSFLPPLVALSNLLGIQWMLPLRLDRDFNLIILGAGIFNIVLALLMVPIWHELGMAFSVLASEIAVPTAMLITLSARGMQPWSYTSVEKRVAA